MVVDPAQAAVIHRAIGWLIGQGLRPTLGLALTLAVRRGAARGTVERITG